MKQIKLGGREVFALIDEADFNLVNKYRWFRNEYGYALYRGGVPKRTIRMHRLILNAPKGLEVDHINGNKLDNRRVNLRLCTKSENLRCREKPKSKFNKYKGAYRRGDYWIVRINKKYIGAFNTEHQAALCYDLWAKDLFGKFAGTNF